jgi:hypothetical protein
METAIYFIACAISIAVLISFFILCNNISKIRKSTLSNYDEYIIHKKIGDKEKAYYHLQRSFILADAGDNIYTKDYYTFFKKLGLGIPDFEEFKKLKDEDEKAK